MVRFSIGKGGAKSGRIEARIESDDALQVQNGTVLDGKGQTLVAFGRGWRWEAVGRHSRQSSRTSAPAELAIFTKPKGRRRQLSTSADGQ